MREEVYLFIFVAVNNKKNPNSVQYQLQDTGNYKFSLLSVVIIMKIIVHTLEFIRVQQGLGAQHGRNCRNTHKLKKNTCVLSILKKIVFIGFVALRHYVIYTSIYNTSIYQRVLFFYFLEWLVVR